MTRAGAPYNGDHRYVLHFSKDDLPPVNAFWIGHEYFFLNGTPETYGSSGIAFLAFFLFQFAFADTCSTITSGAMVGPARLLFRGPR